MLLSKKAVVGYAIAGKLIYQKPIEKVVLRIGLEIPSRVARVEYIEKIENIAAFSMFRDVNTIF
jgi:hypothetical protein